jgi:hypothetical protein
MKSLRGLVGTVRRGRFPERSQRLSFTCGLLCMCHGSDGHHPRVRRLDSGSGGPYPMRCGSFSELRGYRVGRTTPFPATAVIQKSAFSRAL